LGDTAAGLAAQTLMGPDDGVMTVEMKINLMAPGDGDRLRAVGRVERAGRRLTVVRADVFADADGRDPVQVATLLGTMMTMTGKN
jgi:acyl-coenzyme A thioesterase PaaI-like protein